MKKYYKDIIVFHIFVTLKNAHNTMLSEKYMLQNRIYGMLLFCLKVMNIYVID